MVAIQLQNLLALFVTNGDLKEQLPGFPEIPLVNFIIVLFALLLASGIT